MNDEKLKKSSQRFKQLRAENGYSLEKLAKIIQETYNLPISKDSIANYENHPERTAGMRIEYALCFSDLYGVSLDYLLGVSDIRSPDITIQEITEYTGLSEESVAYLAELQQKEKEIIPPITEFIDYLLYNIACYDPKLSDDLGIIDYWRNMWLFIALLNNQIAREKNTPEQTKNKDDDILTESELESFTKEHAILYAARELSDKIHDYLKNYIALYLPDSIGEDK